MTENAVIATNLTRRFGDFTAVDHINFEVKTGEIVGYLGPNGCGKTTTIRMLLGLLEPTEGSASVLGFDAFKQTEEVRARCGYMSQKFALYDDLTVLENLVFYGGVYGIKDKKRILETLALVGLSGRERELTKGSFGGLAAAAGAGHCAGAPTQTAFSRRTHLGRGPCRPARVLGADLSTGRGRRDHLHHHPLHG
ncbi:MAG: ABC transporter ATP-binding protein [Anaerolineaceae bacterium]|nr:ABC transporter ATP-binding protein [Anaerolineaceae bacterium]